LKDRLLQQVPVIGRDRMKHRSIEQAPLQLSGAPAAFIQSGASSAQLALVGGGGSSHSRSNSRGDLLTSSSSGPQQAS